VSFLPQPRKEETQRAAGKDGVEEDRGNVKELSKVKTDFKDHRSDIRKLITLHKEQPYKVLSSFTSHIVAHNREPY